MLVLAPFLQGALAISAPPIPTAWPTSFAAVYLSNLTDPSLGGNGSLPRVDPATVVPATVYYDYAVAKAQRVDHGAGADECVRFYGTALPCTTLMDAGGLYRLLQGSAGVAQPCCRDIPGLACPPPDWAAAATAGREYLGVAVEAVSALACHHWRWPMKGNYSHYYEALSSGRPARWTFPASDGLEDWYFVQGSFVVAPQPRALFALPGACATTNCTKGEARAARHFTDGGGGGGGTCDQHHCLSMADCDPGCGSCAPDGSTRVCSPTPAPPAPTPGTCGQHHCLSMADCDPGCAECAPDGSTRVCVPKS